MPGITFETRRNPMDKDRNGAHNGQVYPLSAAPADQPLRLVGIHSGRGLRRRLADLGLTVGSKVQVVQRESWGPLIVAVRDDARMAIGRGVAHKIMVEPALNGYSNGHKQPKGKQATG
jgi:ferrous iron transport protein A